MTKEATIACYKAYLTTGDPQYHPDNMQKQASRAEVDAWKARLSPVRGHNKEARAGHPNNLAMAQLFRPGIMSNVPQTRVRNVVNGDPHSVASQALSFDLNPSTAAYLNGHSDKAASPQA